MLFSGLFSLYKFIYINVFLPRYLLSICICIYLSPLYTSFISLSPSLSHLSVYLCLSLYLSIYHIFIYPLSSIDPSITYQYIHYLYIDLSILSMHISFLYIICFLSSMCLYHLSVICDIGQMCGLLACFFLS